MAADNAVLSQREIDALLSADLSKVDTEEAFASLARPAKREAARVKLYDFRHPEKLSKDQLRSLQIMQQSVAGSMAASFSGRLRAPVEARLSALERGIYEEYLGQIGGASIVVIIDMSPLSGYAVASFGVDVAFGILDRLLGGRGKRNRKALNRDLTDIELALIRHIGMDISRSLVEPWGRVTELTPEVTDVALGTQVLHVVPPSEFVITAWYEVRFADQTGGISLCFPLNILEQILPKLSGGGMFEARPGRQHEGEKVRDGHLMPMTVPLKVLLGGARVPAGDIANLAPGDVIVLDHEAHEPLRIFIGNCERFAGAPGTRGRRMAVSVTSRVDDDGWLQPFEGEAP